MNHAPQSLPATTPPAEPTGIVLNKLLAVDPCKWVAVGWRDFRRAPVIGIFYGACFTVMGWLLL